jgi:hypothetical protein
VTENPIWESGNEGFPAILNKAFTVRVWLRAYGKSSQLRKIIPSAAKVNLVRQRKVLIFIGVKKVR